MIGMGLVHKTTRKAIVAVITMVTTMLMTID